MSRSGYSDDGEYLNLYRGSVERAINGKRGQAFLTELAAAMDAMSEKRLIAHELIDASGAMCTIGVVCKARGIDVSGIDLGDAELIGELVGIAESMAREIEYENDESVVRKWDADYKQETPEQRWIRMRKWVDDNMHACSEEK